MKVLLCLMSDQHVPNLLSVHHFQPDHVVLVESAAMKSKRVADLFLNALDLGDRPYKDRCDRVPLEAEDTLESVKKALQAAYRLHPDATWIANLTGGTKPMSIATYEFFKALGGSLVYTNVTRPAQIMDVLTGKTETCHHRLCIKEFLAGYGFESAKADGKIQEAEQRASQWADCASVLARHASAGDLLKLSDADRRKARDKGLSLVVDQLQLPAGADVRAVLLRTFWNGLAEPRHLSKYEIEFLTGGWLEVFFWNLLTRHAAALDVWNVRLGLEVRQSGTPAGNDFDVAFMHKYGLSMMECKSGDQEHDPGADILYKVEAVTRQFRALRVRSYLATTASNIMGNNGQIKMSLQTRADIYGCRILTCSSIRELAEKEHDPATVRKHLLDQQGV